mmetsp:Transcript_33684/g.112453  ORF Transcript_33684/g.112453 Transcript_33684/m.112453 type:complete len:283 (+) Transcript_33684:338-1186(+)
MPARQHLPRALNLRGDRRGVEEEGGGERVEVLLILEGVRVEVGGEEVQVELAERRRGVEAAQEGGQPGRARAQRRGEVAGEALHRAEEREVRRGEVSGPVEPRARQDEEVDPRLRVEVVANHKIARQQKDVLGRLRLGRQREALQDLHAGEAAGLGRLHEQRQVSPSPVVSVVAVAVGAVGAFSTAAATGKAAPTLMALAALAALAAAGDSAPLLQRLLFLIRRRPLYTVRRWRVVAAGSCFALWVVKPKLVGASPRRKRRSRRRISAAGSPEYDMRARHRV